MNSSVSQVVRFSTPQEALHNSTDIGTEGGVKDNKAEAFTAMPHGLWFGSQTEESCFAYQPTSLSTMTWRKWEPGAGKWVDGTRLSYGP